MRSTVAQSQKGRKPKLLTPKGTGNYACKIYRGN